MRTKALIIWLCACAAPAAPAPQAPPPAQPAPAPATIIVAAPAGSTTTTYRNQPPALKLKLGHYSNGQGIGVTIDLSEHIDNVAKIPPAKVRFDGDSKVWRLAGQHGPMGRIDFVHDGGGVMLHVWDDGRRAVYVPDPDTGKWSDEIDVWRDGDADPL